MISQDSNLGPCVWSKAAGIGSCKAIRLNACSRPRMRLRGGEQALGWVPSTGKTKSRAGLSSRPWLPSSFLDCTDDPWDLCCKHALGAHRTQNRRFLFFRTRLVCPEFELLSPGDILESLRRLGSRPRLMFCSAGIGTCVEFNHVIEQSWALLWVDGEPWLQGSGSQLWQRITGKC